jgi:hypothetical protein
MEGAMPRERMAATGGDIEIGWGRDHGTVEVATTIPDAPGRVAAILTEANIKLVNGTTGTEPGTAQLEQAMALLSGWHTRLDGRSQVNFLIRKLRTARDQAFGRDE